MNIQNQNMLSLQYSIQIFKSSINVIILFYILKKSCVVIDGLFASPQAMIEEAITRAESFSVMYTPFATKIRADKVEKVKEVFTKTHPAYVEYIYTGKIPYLQLIS